MHQLEEDLAKLIEASYSAKEAEACGAFKAEPAALAEVGAKAVDILKHFPWAPKSCALMSALWTAHIRDNSDLPVHQVAGILEWNGRRIFGNDSSADDLAAGFNESNSAWDGHSWIVLPGYVGDISIFRTTYSGACPQPFADFVLDHFGRGRGMLLYKSQDLARAGLMYVPRYVLTDHQVTLLVRGAKHVIDMTTDGRRTQ